jgi:phosphopantetheine--protein transferase-like protein
LISTGNDIIALSAIDQQRTKQERFYTKILSPSELELYYHKAYAAMSFENFVWLLWSVKESVFKYQQRNIPTLLFSPVKIVIQGIDFPESIVVTKFETVQYESSLFYDGEFYNCKVNAGRDIFYSRSKIHDELVYTVVDNSDKFENIWWGIKFISHSDHNNQSKAVRSFVLNKLNTVFPSDNLTIKQRVTGYPLVLKGTNQIDIPVSFTHHGHFIAYSFVLVKFINCSGINTLDVINRLFRYNDY